MLELDGKKYRPIFESGHSTSKYFKDREELARVVPSTSCTIEDGDGQTLAIGYVKKKFTDKQNGKEARKFAFKKAVEQMVRNKAITREEANILLHQFFTRRQPKAAVKNA